MFALLRIAGWMMKTFSRILTVGGSGKAPAKCWPGIDGKIRRNLSIAAVAIATLAACQGAPRSAQPDLAVAQPPSPDEVARMLAYNNMPDTPGTGQYAAIKEMAPGLPEHVVYRPADLSRVPAGSLGIVGWGNGGCSTDGASARQHLAELASHGYVAVAPGGIQSGPGSTPPPPPPPAADGSLPLLRAETSAAQVMAGVEWLLAENQRRGSPYYGKIDPKLIAVSGHSCGGLQAIELAGDPRVRAVVIHNSGVFREGSPVMLGMSVSKANLARFHTPILYIQGGPSDIAYENGMDDFRRIEGVPVAMLNNPVGHGGTFFERNGGENARVALAWLNWQLRGDSEARRLFAGDDCGLCGDPRWTVERKNFAGL